MLLIVLILYIYSAFQCIIGFLGGITSDIHGFIIGDSDDDIVCEQRHRSNVHFLKWIVSLILATILAANFVI